MADSNWLCLALFWGFRLFLGLPAPSRFTGHSFLATGHSPLFRSHSPYQKRPAAAFLGWGDVRAASHTELPKRRRSITPSYV